MSFIISKGLSPPIRVMDKFSTHANSQHAGQSQSYGNQVRVVYINREKDKTWLTTESLGIVYEIGTG